MSGTINDVSDTSFWVAHYRAIEGDRSDALFKDPWAARLAGEKGREIAKKMPASKYTGWSVVVRTRIIDAFIEGAIANGVDTVLSLGAGLDARPYRLTSLPSDLRYIEVDYPHVIAFKEKVLNTDKPVCRLTRVSLDLADRTARRSLFAEVAANAKKVIVLTEGVIPYLTNDQVAQLAEALHAQPKFCNWIVDYNAPKMLEFVRKHHGKKMQHAPFQFAPTDWPAFFSGHGWKIESLRYLPEESVRLGRMPPRPWFVPLLMLLPGAKKRAEFFKKMGGYALLAPQ